MPRFAVPPGLIVATPTVDALVAEGRISEVFAESAPPEGRLELLASYQVGEWLRAEMAAGRIPDELMRAAREQLSRSEKHVSWLLASAEKFVAALAWKAARARCGDEWGRQLLPDLIAEGTVVALQCARFFDPGRAREFCSYLASRLRHRFVDLIEESRRSAAGIPESVTSMVRLARGKVLPELARTLGRPPSSEELSKALIDARLDKALRDSNIDPSTAGPVELDAAMARLRRSGFLAAATSGLPEVLAALEGDLSLDGGGGPGQDRVSLGETIASGSDTEADALGGGMMEDLLGVSLGGLDPDRAAMVARHWEARSDSDEAVPWRSTAAEFGVAWTDLRDMVTVAEARLASPHTQFCCLAGGLPGQFEPAERPGDERPPALAALRRRLATPA